MQNSRRMAGFVGLALANFVAMFLISGSGVIGYAVAGDYDVLAQVSLIFALESAARCPTIALSGKLGEKLGRKQLLIFAIALYTASLTVTVLVSSFVVFLVARIFSGIAWGLWMSNSFVLFCDIFGQDDAPKYSGYSQTLSTIAMMIAAPVAGLLVGFGWRVEYTILIPILLLVLVLCVVGVPKTEKASTGKPMDVGGTIFTILFLVCFCLSMSMGNGLGWGNPLILALVAGAVVGLIGLIISERKAADPIFPVRLLKNKFYLSIFVISFMYFLANSAGNYLPSYLQYYADVSSTLTGFVLTPGIVIAAVLTTILGRKAAKTGMYRGMTIIWALGTLTTGVLLLFVGGPFFMTMPFVFTLVAMLPQASVNSCGQIVPYTYPLKVLEPKDLATGTSFMVVSGTFGASVGDGISGALMNLPSGMVNVFKFPVLCAVVMLVFSVFFFKDIKAGERL